MKNEQHTVRPDLSGGFNREALKVRFDPEAYAHHIAELDLDDAQKLALMRTVWDLMVLFVDAGFGIDAPTLAGADNDKTKIALRREPQAQTPEEASP